MMMSKQSNVFHFLDPVAFLGGFLGEFPGCLLNVVSIETVLAESFELALWNELRHGSVSLTENWVAELRLAELRRRLRNGCR